MIARSGRVWVLALAAALTLAQGSAAAAEEALTYTVTYPGSSASRVRIAIDATALGVPQTLVMPRAVPMAYEEQPYDRFVGQVEAFSGDGRRLDVERQEGPRWLVKGSAPIRRVVYEVDLAQMEKEILEAASSSKTREGYAGLLGYSVFAFFEGYEARRCRLVVRAPDGWPVFSTLVPEAPPEKGSLRAEAADFYALADSQVMMGPRLAVRREEARVPFFIASYAEGPFDADSAARLAANALDAMIDYFGQAPFAHYSVLVESLLPVDAAHHYGFSMEHLDSSTYFLSSEQTLSPEASASQTSRAAYNFAHHIAHAWIPKRAAGEGYFPFSWEFAPVIDTIWFSEGFGQYAAADALADHRQDGESYRRAVVQRRFRSVLEEAPLSLRTLSAVDLSRIASTRYARDFRTGENSFARGGMMAAEMDEAIRLRSAGRKRLRDALRHLVAWSREKRRGFRLEELPEILKAGTGVDVRAIFEKWLTPQVEPREVFAK